MTLVYLTMSAPINGVSWGRHLFTWLCLHQSMESLGEDTCLPYYVCTNQWRFLGTTIVYINMSAPIIGVSWERHLFTLCLHQSMESLGEDTCLPCYVCTNQWSLSGKTLIYLTISTLINGVSWGRHLFTWLCLHQSMNSLLQKELKTFINLTKRGTQLKHIVYI